MQTLPNAPEHSGLTRRQLLQAASAGALGLTTGAWAQGSDKPEKEEVRIGFIPLTDCASVVMASVLGFDKKYGVKIIPSKEASWAGVRDKLVNGELDMAHVDRKSTRLNSSHSQQSRMPSSA